MNYYCLYNYIFVISILLLSFILTGCDKQAELLQPTIDELVDYEPEMVGPYIISKASFEGHASITPDKKEIYFTVYSNDHGYSIIAYSQNSKGTWTEPQIPEFSGKYRDGSPALSPDGSRLYFSSNRPVNGSKLNESNDIWYVDRIASGRWSSPVWLGDKINTSYNEFSPSVDIKGNLFFCSNRPSGFGDMDIYVADFEDGKLQEPRILDHSINTEYHEGNVGISPDGKLLLFMVQNKPGDFGYDDIHYSVKVDGKWRPGKNIGSIINTYTYDFSPKVSPDGKMLYFASRINRSFISPDVPVTYKLFQEHLNSPLNGFGNIYRIELRRINLKVDG